MARKKAPAQGAPSHAVPRQEAPGGARGTAHPELIGLGLVALGLFLAVVLWLGWDGGAVGSRIERRARLAGRRRPARAAARRSLGVGGLMVARSGLVDVRPFRTGRRRRGRRAPDPARRRERRRSPAASSTACSSASSATSGTIILGAFAFTVGVVLLTGASLGALLRRSAGARAAGAQGRRGAPLAAAPGSGRSSRWRSRAASRRRWTARIALPRRRLRRAAADARPRRPARRRARWNDEPSSETAELSLFEPPATEHAAYVLPDPSLLRRSRPTEGSREQALERTAETLVQALGHHGVEATVIGQVSGPRVTRYEIQLAPGTKVGKVAALKDDLAYALATTEIRILAPIPGKQAVGVEVPNLAPNIVTLGDIFDTLPANASPVSTWLGKDISGAVGLGRPRADAAHPHRRHDRLGQVGLHQHHALLDPAPRDARRGADDPRRPEARRARPLRVDPAPAHARRLEPEGRRGRAGEHPHRDGAPLRAHERRPRAHAARAEPRARARGEAPLPYLLVVIDELADLMMVSPQEVEDAVIRLAQKSRAVGIHLVLATQRPSVDVITGMIKANVPSRIAFAVSSQTDSRVILDTAGAESLLGQGDMLFKPLGTSRLQRVQGAYVSEEEIALVVEACRGQREQELDETLLEAPGVGAEDEEDDEGDSIPTRIRCSRAIEIVVATQTASVSLLQRRLRVGYTRAGRLIDMLERRGIISGYEGSKPRRVLVGEHDLERVLAGELSHAAS